MRTEQIVVRQPHIYVCVLLVAVALVACGPGASSGAPGSDGGGQRGPTAQSRTLVIAMPDEPVTIAAKPARIPSGQSFGDTRPLFSAGLAVIDQAGDPRPYLAEALPLLNTENWRLHPDGRMETTYRLRPNLTWHDGTPAVAEDFVFAWRVYTTPALGSSGTLPQRVMEEMVAPDPRTVIIRWRQPYPEAGALKSADFQALPRHILEQPFERGEPEAFVAHPYWRHEYVGMGPYRLERWEPGAFIEGGAFGGHALGRPKIERIRLVPISDQNTVLANLLAETVHLTTDNAADFAQMRILQGEWGPRNGGAVLLSSSSVRYTQVQFKPEVANPRAILDLRVRKALAHTLDKQALNEGLLDGQSEPAHSFISPQLGYFSAVDRAIAKYPYDLRPAEQLMAEAGFTRGRDGFYESPTDGRFSPELMVSSGAEPRMKRKAPSWWMAGGVRG